MKNPTVKNIVLVHGEFVDGSGWRGVYSILKGKGYLVSVVGHPNTGLNDDIAATKLVLDRQDDPVILVGHSYGGAIITEAGNEPIVAGLVYVSALAPNTGESVGALYQSGPRDPKNGMLPPRDGYVWYDTKKFHAGFCADLPADLAEFMADSQVPVAAATFGATICEAAWRTKPSWYCVATEDHTIPPDAQRFMARRAGSRTTEIKGSHVIFISQPVKVAAVIEGAAMNALKRFA